MVGDQVLVRGHDRPAVGERRADQRAGRLVAAHDLDDHVDPRVRDQVRRRVGQQGFGDSGGLRALDVADGDAGEHERRAVGGCQPGRPFEERTHDLAAHGARAEHADTQRLEAHRQDRAAGRCTIAMVPTARWTPTALRYTPAR